MPRIIKPWSSFSCFPPFPDLQTRTAVLAAPEFDAWPFPSHAIAFEVLLVLGQLNFLSFKKQNIENGNVLCHLTKLVSTANPFILGF